MDGQFMPEVPSKQVIHTWNLKDPDSHSCVFERHHCSSYVCSCTYCLLRVWLFVGIVYWWYGMRSFSISCRRCSCHSVQNRALWALIFLHSVCAPQSALEAAVFYLCMTYALNDCCNVKEMKCCIEQKQIKKHQSSRKNVNRDTGSICV